MNAYNLMGPWKFSKNGLEYMRVLFIWSSKSGIWTNTLFCWYIKNHVGLKILCMH